MKKEIFEEYAKMKRLEVEVADKLDELKPQLVEEMRANDLDKVESDYGNFTLGDTTRWEYSPAVAALQEQEKANGKAKRNISTVLRFTKPKE